jgi:glucose-6-phosphate dehydrogenase assembly protein OpcA
MIIRNILGILLLATSYLAAILAIIPLMMATIPIYIWLKAGKLGNEIIGRDETICN